MDLQKAFDSTSKVLFGQEIGRLEEFEGYLSEVPMPFQKKKSFTSGKPIIISHPFYPKDAKFISQDEIGEVNFPPLDINQIKDIDSLLSAVSDRTIYCGNKLFGNSHEVSQVDNCWDSHYIQSSHNVFEVKYGAYCSYLRESECVFGAFGFPGSRFSMRMFDGIGATRCFECWIGTNLSEVYYAFNCIGCQECIFAFNLRGKRHVIGNLELSKDKYLELKKKLTWEMGEELKKKKRLFSIADLAFLGRDKKEIKADEFLVDSPVPPRVETAFGKTTSLLLGKSLSQIRSYSPWLLSHAMETRNVKGASGSPTYKLPWLPVVGNLPADRLLPLNEALEYSTKNKISLGSNESPSLQELSLRVSKIARFSFEFIDGYHENCADIPSLFTAYDCYKMWDATHAKYSAYCTAATKSEHIFGAHLRVLLSQFCINCFDSTKLYSCFEVDSSYSSRDCYFCHNIENCSDCIFCFNAKNLKYAVGNTQVGREEYLRIKGILLSFLQKELEARKSLPLSIFSIPKVKKK